MTSRYDEDKLSDRSCVVNNEEKHYIFKLEPYSLCVRPSQALQAQIFDWSHFFILYFEANSIFVFLSADQSSTTAKVVEVKIT